MTGSAKPIAFSRAVLARRRANFIRGGSFFFTANLAERRLRLLADTIDLLRQAFRYVRRRHPFDIEAIVLLPDHLHAIWTLPEGDADFALRWRRITPLASQSALPSLSRQGWSDRSKMNRSEHRQRNLP